MKLLLALIILQTAAGVVLQNIPGDLTNGNYDDSVRPGSFAASDWTPIVYRHEGSSLTIQATYPPSIYIYINSEPKASDALGDYRVNCYPYECVGPGGPTYTRSGSDYSIVLTFDTESSVFTDRPSDYDKRRPMYVTVKLGNDFYNIVWIWNSAPPKLYLSDGSQIDTARDQPGASMPGDGTQYTGLTKEECEAYARAYLSDNGFDTFGPTTYVEAGSYPVGCSTTPTAFGHYGQYIIWNADTDPANVAYKCGPGQAADMHCLIKTSSAPPAAPAVDCNTHKNAYRDGKCCPNDSKDGCATLKTAYENCVSNSGCS